MLFKNYLKTVKTNHNLATVPYIVCIKFLSDCSICCSFVQWSWATNRESNIKVGVCPTTTDDAYVYTAQDCYCQPSASGKCHHRYNLAGTYYFTSGVVAASVAGSLSLLYFKKPICETFRSYLHTNSQTIQSMCKFFIV